MRFTVFSDLHYKKRMYASTIADVERIIERAHDSGSELLLHAGDLCNDYSGSPELFKTLMKNKCELPVYGVFGNHELEGAGNSTESVIPMLTNREVNFAEGCGYYYFDRGGFRFICLDTNYSLLNGEWVHNTTNSYGPPAGSTRCDSLGPKWLEATLFDALDKGLRCITVSHAEFSGNIGRGSIGDAAAVRELFARVNAVRKTVILAINGHYHTDHVTNVDGVIYFDCNSARNGFWMPTYEQHYSPEQTFDFTDYDKNGEPTDRFKLPLYELSQAKHTWFFDSPVCAVIDIDGDRLEITGAETSWMYGIENPETELSGVKPGISSRVIEL